MINPKTEKRIAGKGLPFSKNNNKKGDLKIKFDIIFPDNLNEMQREGLNQVFLD